MSHDPQLRTTFDRAASLYQKARPDYPDELYADLLTMTGVKPPARLLEVGCGPGKATLPLARMGFRITAIELGEALAEEPVVIRRGTTSPCWSGGDHRNVREVGLVVPRPWNRPSVSTSSRRYAAALRHVQADK